MENYPNLKSTAKGGADFGGAHQQFAHTLCLKSYFKMVKKVYFNDIISIVIIDNYDRRGYWYEDRIRFKNRCLEVCYKISYCFEEQHRKKVLFKLYVFDKHFQKY